MAKSKTKSRDFFIVDIDKVREAARYGINEVVSYITMACGTGADSQTTNWSANAIQKYMGLKKGATKKAITNLIKAKLIELVPDCTRPKYTLVANCNFTLPHSERQKKVYDALKNDEPIDILAEKQILNTLLQYGAIANNGTEEKPDYQVVEIKYSSELNNIAYLPNDLVMGFRNKISILRKLRETGETGAIILLLDLYTVFDLSENYGITVHLVHADHKNYKENIALNEYIACSSSIHRDQESVYTNHQIAKLNSTILTQHEDDLLKEDGAKPSVIFFHRLKILENVKAVFWVPFVFESDEYDAQPIFPICTGNGRAIDGNLGRLSREIAILKMFNDIYSKEGYKYEQCLNWLLQSNKENSRYLYILLKYQTKAVVKSILRPTTWAKTDLNLRRYSEYQGYMEEERRKLIDIYEREEKRKNSIEKENHKRAFEGDLGDYRFDEEDSAA